MLNRGFKSVMALTHPSVLLILLSVGLLIAHILYSPNLLKNLRAETLHNYTLSMTFDPQDFDVSVKTYLPRTDERQEIIRESVLSGQLQFDDRADETGRYGVWSGERVTEIQYRALISSKAIRFELDPALQIEPRTSAQLAEFLGAAEGIQVGHPEIEQAWLKIQPAQAGHILPVLESIHNYILNDIDTAPFKGFTDALTALRLQQASCNGKGRLFVAMARAKNIPARLVGGVILNEGSKRTSHQWVEVFIQDQWVPFDPTNGHFASLPANYLKLYIGDQPLFTHTRNINFDYRFTINRSQTSPALFRFEEEEVSQTSVNAAELLKLTGLTEQMIGVFLLFPLATLITVFLRNIVGLKTFGIFMPMLVAAACVQTGLVEGLIVFGGVVAFSFAGQVWLNRYNLLKIPRLAAIITLCTLLFIGVLLIFRQRVSFEFGVLALFPVVIISFLAERIHKMASEDDWKGVTVSGLGSLLTIALCYGVFSSVTLQGLFALMPELLLMVLALQIAAGQWSGMRVSEFFRFRRILPNGPVLGINERNRAYVNRLNNAQLLDIAADKLRSKSLLSESNVPVAETLATCSNYKDLGSFLKQLYDLDEFVLKPNRGSQGNGILVISERDDQNFITAGGRCLTLDQISRHTSEILSGSFSQDGVEDIAYVEPLLRQHKSLNRLAALGLSDIRVILHQGKPISAMLRVPTSRSGGKANLHQGAVGLAIDIRSGEVVHASINGISIHQHPDTKVDLIGYRVPSWSKILDISRNATQAIPLGYIGVDVCIDQTRGPLVLEVNGRPGIEIQNVQRKGLFEAPVLERPEYA